jgi:predicted dehydrogenase
VMSIAKTFIPERPTADGRREKVTVDDAFVSLMEFDNGALGTIEATRFANGRKNGQIWEINGEKGSLRFNLERFNELEVYLPETQPRETQGFTNVLVTEPYHPFWENWWPQGHIIGWEHTFVHEFHHFFDAIVNKKDVTPYGADFVDGYKNAVICDAILNSSESGRSVDIKY